MPPGATAALRGADSNQSSRSSHTESGSVRRNSIISRRPSARNFLPRPSSGRSSPREEALMSGAGVV